MASLQTKRLRILQLHGHRNMQNSTFIKNKSLEFSIKSFQQPNVQTSVPQKYVYFHQNSRRNPYVKIAFPYNALNISYFEKTNEQRRQKKIQNSLHFNTNKSIRNFLNSKLKIPVVKQEQNSPEQIYIGKKVTQKVYNIDQNFKIKLLSSISKQNSPKISKDQTKCQHNKNTPNVLKIKSKKAYFLSRFKSIPKTDNTQTIARINLQQPQEPNFSELKYRSKTQDNINMINLMRKQNNRAKKQRTKKKYRKDLSQETFDPWEVQSVFMESSLKFQ